MKQSDLSRGFGPFCPKFGQTRVSQEKRGVYINLSIDRVYSPISCLLFLLYMSKLPKLIPYTRRSLFADDYMIYSESPIAQSDLIQSDLQTSMDALALFNSDHRIILSCTKSVRVLFERRKCKQEAQTTRRYL